MKVIREVRKMEKNHPIDSLMLTAMTSIENMIDVNTVVGEMITSPDGTVIIPVSKECFGYLCRRVSKSTFSSV